MTRLTGLMLIISVMLVCNTGVKAAGNIKSLQNETVDLLREYIRINTVNPPGNESRAVEFFARIFKREGISYETAESAPGRGNIWARLQGGNEPALILLSHTDVVPADPEHWDVEPFAGIIKDGYIYGRGALDMKSIGILFLQSFLGLHRQGRHLDRDVLFMATADEEAGGNYGAGWLVKNHPEVFKGTGMLLNEGGGGGVYGKRQVFSIEVAQKTPFWLKLTASDKAGHGSSPRVMSAPVRLINALTRINNYSFTPRVVPSVDAYFREIAGLQDSEWRVAYANMDEAIRDPDFLLRLQLHDHRHHALLRNTCSITRLQGSDKINVVPSTASAEIDCRLLPDQDHQEFLTLIKTLINDPRIKTEILLSFTAAASPTGTTLYRAVAEGIRKYYPQALILPGVSAGFTDSHYFRDLGIDSYGFAPFLISPEEGSTVHGNNERISITNVKQGVRMLMDILDRVVYRSNQ